MNYQEGIRRVSYVNAGLVFLCCFALSLYQMDSASGQFEDVLPLFASIAAISLCPIFFGKILQWSIKKSKLTKLKSSLYIALLFALLSCVWLCFHHSNLEDLIAWLLWLLWGSLALTAFAVWVDRLYLWCVEGFLSQPK